MICIPTSYSPSTDSNSFSSYCKEVTWLVCLGATPILNANKLFLLAASQRPALLFAVISKVTAGPQLALTNSTFFEWIQSFVVQPTGPVSIRSEHRTSGVFVCIHRSPPLSTHPRTSFASHEFIHYSRSLPTPCGRRVGAEGWTQSACKATSVPDERKSVSTPKRRMSRTLEL